MADKRFSVDAVFRAIDRVTAPVTRMQNRVGKMTRSVGRNVDRLNRKMDKFGARARKGALVVAAATAVATAAFADVVRVGADFEQDLIVAATKFPGIIKRGTDAFQELEDAAREAGRTTEFTASQAAQALKFEAQMGATAAQAIALLPVVIDLATNAELDLAEATDIAFKSLGAFNLRTKDSVKLTANLTRVTDVLGAVANSSGTDVSQFFEVISQAGGVLESAGGSVETFGALAGTLANNAKTASDAGTLLKNVLLSLTAASPEAKAALTALDVDIADKNGDVRDLIDIFDDLGRALEPLGSAARQDILKTIFQKRGILGADIILKAGTESLKEYVSWLETVGGTSKTLADIIRESLKNEMKEFASAVESVKISTFVRIREEFSKIVNEGTKWVRANEELISTKLGDFLLKVFNNLDKIASTAEKIAKVGIAVAGVVIFLKALALVLGIVNLLMLTGPVGWAIAIAAVAVVLGVLLGELLKKIPGVEEAFHAAGEGIKKGLGAAIDWIRVAWADTVGFIIDSADWIKNAFNDAVGFGRGAGNLWGLLGDDDEEAPQGAAGGPQPQVIGTGEQVARSIEERVTANSSEVTIRDETGRAEVTGGALGPGLILQPTGAFE